jgi:rhodanese-related sulfurtransferase
VAARRAVKAGYENVNVMVDGIKGWKQGGQPTTLVGNSESHAS